MRTVIYGATRNLYGSMVTACKSLVAHGGADRVIFLTEDDCFPEKLPDLVECINVSGQRFFTPAGPNFKSQFTWMALMRTALPFMPGMHGRILWLDVDTIVDGKLDQLWSLPSYPLYMAEEIDRVTYNSGVMLMELDQLRDDFVQVIRRLETVRCKWADQGAINDVMAGRIRALPREFNVGQATRQPVGVRPVIYHWMGEKVWTNKKIWKQYEAMSWSEALRMGGYGAPLGPG